MVDHSILSAPSLFQVPKIKIDSNPVTIRKVRVQEFDLYLQSIERVIDKYQLYKQQGNTALEGIPDLEEEVEDIEAKVQGLMPLKQQKSLDRLNRSRMLPQKTSQVPEYFHDLNFDLGNPHTFSQVVEYKDVICLNASEEEITFRNLQDKLILYRDTVEVKLLQEISRRSSQFFDALVSLQDLEKETKVCVEKIGAIKETLNEISDVNIKEGLELVRLQQQRSNQAVLFHVVTMLENARESKPVIETLLNQADYLGALDLIEETCAILKSVQGGSTKPLELAQGITILENDSFLQNVDLKSITSIVQLTTQLQELSFAIQQKLQQEFISVLARDIKGFMEGSVPTPAQPFPFIKGSFSGTPNVSTPSMTDIRQDLVLSQNDEALKGVLTPLVIGLLRMDKLDVVLAAYKDLFFKEIKSGSRQYYPKLPDPPKADMTKEELKKWNDDQVSKLLKNMTFDTFYNTLIKIFGYFLRALQRAAVVNDIVVKIIKEAEKNGLVIGKSKLPTLDQFNDKPKIQEEDDDFGNLDLVNLPEARQSEVTRSSVMMNEKSAFAVMVEESRNVLYAATDLTHTRCAKLITVRSDQNAQLNPKDFYRLFHSSWEFLIAGEQLCGKLCFGLKGSLLAQAKSFINYFHEEKSKQMVLLLENEQWLQADIPIDFQHLTEQLQSQGLLSVNTESYPRKSVTKESVLDNDDDEIDLTMAARTVNSSSESVATPENATSSKYILVDGSKYYAVVSTLMFLKMLSEYVQCAKNIPTLAPEVLNRIYEFLKLFNSRTCQLILGSGAMRSAGLERITAKHIALTSQSLGLVMAVIPYVRTGISNLINVKQHVLLADFDRIIGDFRDHQNELYLNLINIMMARLAEHAANLVAINWDTPDKKDFCSDGISVPMSVLVKETQTLHKVTSKFLPPEALRSILNEVFRSYVRRLEDDFNKKIDLFSSAGKNRLLADVHYLIENLSSLDGVDGPGSQLEVCVNNIKIKDKRTYVPPPKQTPAASPEKKATTPQPKSTFAYNFGNMLRSKNENAQ